MLNFDSITPFGRARWLAAAACLALALAACAEKADEPKPTAPNMTPLVEAYDAPNVDFTAETAPEIVAATLNRIPVLGSFCGWESLDDFTCDGCLPQCDGFDALLGLLDAVRKQQETGQNASPLVLGGSYATHRQGLEIGGSEFDGDGFLRVRRICDGGDATAAADEAANGRIDLTLGFTAAGFDPVIWGDFLACKMALADRLLLLDAGVRLYWDAGDGFSLESLSDLSALVALDGSVTIGAEQLDVDLDLRVLADGQLELRIPLDDTRNVVFFVSPTGPGYRAANGLFSCDFASNTCTDNNGNAYGF